MKTEVKSPKRGNSLRFRVNKRLDKLSRVREMRMWSDLGLTRMSQRVSSVSSGIDAKVLSLRRNRSLDFPRRKPEHPERRIRASLLLLPLYISGFLGKIRFGLFFLRKSPASRDETLSSLSLCLLIRANRYSCVEINRRLGSYRRVW